VRLGFALLSTTTETGADGVHRDMQLWVSELSASTRSRAS
jgi:hypothetical protein